MNAGDARGFDRLVTVVAAVALRRTKTQKLPDGRYVVQLPDKKVRVERVDLDLEDRDLYARYLARAKREVDRADAEGEFGGAFYATILECILRLRQLCCHSALVPGVATDDGGGEQLANRRASLDARAEHGEPLSRSPQSIQHTCHGKVLEGCGGGIG